jgi:hypothetical protein
MGSTPTRKGDKAQGAATTQRSQAEEAGSWSLHRGDRSFVGEPAPKRQKTAEPGSRVAPRHHLLRHNACSHRGGWRRRGGLHCSNTLHHRGRHRSTRRRRQHHQDSQGRRPNLRRQKSPQWGDPTRRPRHLPQEGRVPRSPSGNGGGATLSKQLSPHAFLCSILFLDSNLVGICQDPLP